MRFDNIKNNISRYIANLPGWRTNRKIVVIESDDWGSIRMPSKEVYEKCLKAGYPVDKIAYEKYDSLLSHTDLELLFGLLSKHKDKNGNYPIITANCVVANPDFERILQDNFEKYHYELITETFLKYPEHADNFKLWQQGINNKIFYPQYHAREHLNVSLFMDALRKGDPDVHFGFNHMMPGCISHGPGMNGNLYVEALAYNSPEDKRQKLDIFLEGLDLFEKLFGYRSESIIPPNYIWSPDFNEAVFNKGVKYFQGSRKMREPDGNGENKYHSYFVGRRNNLGQIYLVRNSWFEPSMLQPDTSDSLERCLSHMAIAFKMKKPSIVSSHRLNYVGFIEIKNRDRTLIMMDKLLSTALRRWPDIEFMTSSQLGELITTNIE